MSQRNKAYANRMKQLKVKTKRQRAKSNQFKTKKNTPEIFNSVATFSCAENRNKCKAYQRLLYILKLYNNFLSSFTETYHKELSSSTYSLDVISLPESPVSNISPSSPISSYNSFSPNTSPYTSPYSQSNTSKSGISPFDIVTRPNLKPSKSNHKKKKSNKSNNKSKKKKLKSKSYKDLHKDKKSNKKTYNSKSYKDLRKDKKSNKKTNNSNATDDTDKYRRNRRKQKLEKEKNKLNKRSKSLNPSKSKSRKPAKSAADKLNINVGNGNVNNKLKGGFYDLYMSKCGEYNNIYLINDFSHICEKHNLLELITETKKELMSGDNKNICILNECISLNRMYRDRYKCCKHNRFRDVLYLGFINDINEIITQQLMDKIHNYMIHTYDIGILLNPKELSNEYKEDNNNNDDEYKDKQLMYINNLINNKRDILYEITGNNNKYFEKFTSIIDDNIYQNDNNNIGHYSPRYYYWSVYSDWDGIDKSNPGYNYMDWYIEPTFNSLKHELLSGSNRFLSKSQWNNLISLCNLYKHTSEIKMIVADFDDLHGYGIKRYTPIQTQHLLSLLIYCNFEIIRNRFVQTFIRIPIQESDDKLKQRHSRFANLAKLLRESIEVFGERTLFSKVKKFYHCLDKELLFKEISGYFNMPISTSIYYETVINLNKKNGIILELKDNNDTHLNGGLRYFNTQIISDYSYEYECLFISSLSPIHIQTIIYANYGHNYTLFIHSLNCLYTLFKGKRYKNYNNQKNDAEIYKICATKLIQHQLFKNGFNNGKKYKNLPIYIENLLHYFFINTTNIQINYEHLCDGKQFIQFDKLFIENLNNNKYIKLNVILLLFPNISNIIINQIKGRLQFNDDYIFINILKSLSQRGQNVYLQDIMFKEAFTNNMCQFIQKYESKFIQSRWYITQQGSNLCVKQSTFDVV